MNQTVIVTVLHEEIPGIIKEKSFPFEMNQQFVLKRNVPRGRCDTYSTKSQGRVRVGDEMGPRGNAQLPPP